jgi:hypothetical protein
MTFHRIGLTALLLALSCGPYVPPEPPGDDGEATCQSAHETLSALGCEGVDATWDQRCERAQAAEREAGWRYPVRCLTEATTCKEAEVCR